MALTDFGNRPNFEMSLALHSVFFQSLAVWNLENRSYGINSDRKSYRRNQRERERERATKKAYVACKKDPLLKLEDDSLMITNERSNNMSVKQTVVSDHTQH